MSTAEKQAPAMEEPETEQTPENIVRLDAYAKQSGWPSSAALRKWMQRHGLTLYAPPGNVQFVDRDEIKRFVTKSKAPAAPAPKREPKRTDEEELGDALSGLKKR